MNNHSIRSLWQAFLEFYNFAPRQQITILLLMLLQGITSGIGLLFIIPLLQIVGIDLGVTTPEGISNFANNLLGHLGLAPSLEIVLLSYVLIVSTIATIRYQLALKSAVIQQAYICHIRNKLYRGLLHSHWQFITQNKMSDFTHSLSGQVQSIGQACNLMLSLLSQVIIIFVMIALAMLMSWKMSLMALLSAAILLGLLLPLNRQIYGSGKSQLVNFKMIFQMLTEQLSSLKMIKSYASEAYHADQLQQVSAALELQQVRFSRLNAKTRWINMVTTVIAFSLFFYIALTVLSMPLATIFLLLVIFSRLLPQIAGLQTRYQQLLHTVPAFNDVSHMMQACHDAREPAQLKVACPSLQQQISLNNINYCYPNRQTPVIKNLSIQLPKNHTIALVGHSGVGKSTLADLIAGLLVPTAGTIHCDDTLLEGEARLAWREKVAYVTQEVYLFHDTVRANLSWVCTSAPSDTVLWDALQLAAADEFVIALPQGLDTLIGDRGIRLSGGERQRIALARALLSEPQLLILDEATSALDHENERKIQQALEQLQGKLTILIIAHRETTIAHADKRILLE